jgi:hypothetical protein
VRFTRAEQLLSRISEQNFSQDFSIEIALQNGKSLKISYKKERSVGFDISETTYLSGQEMIRFVPDMSSDEIFKILPFAWKDLFQKIGREDLRWIVSRERCFLSAGLFYPELHLRDKLISSLGISLNNEYVSLIKSIIHLPGLRGNPSRTYSRNAVELDFPGTFENYVASVITDWQNNKSNSLTELSDSLEALGLTWKIKAEPRDDTQVELKVGRLPSSRFGEVNDLVSIADVGIGVSQVLPVVVALIVAKPGQVVYLEQPEIHLHPRAQRKLAHVINAAVQRNVIVVVETHSALLLREIQTLVAQGELPPEKVALHWFQRQDDGKTIVSFAELDENGAYGSWPEDFDEVELGAEKDYLDAVESREARR